jgi:hypothetical protein
MLVKHGELLHDIYWFDVNQHVPAFDGMSQKFSSFVEQRY